MDVKLVNIDEVKPYESNPRLNDQAVDAVVASLREFGFRQPIVIDTENTIVVGHTRWKAAKKLGLKRVPVHLATDLTPEQAKAYRIADNQTATLAEWNFDMLSIELNDLQGLDFNLNVLGFDADALSKILDPGVQEGQCDPDDIPEPPDDPITRPGDLWRLGEHRLLCGDAASESDLNRLLDGAVIDMLLTDPPYGVRVEPRSNNAISSGLSSFSKPNGKGKGRGNLKHHQGLDLTHPGKSKGTTKKMRAKDRPLENDFLSPEEFEKLLYAWFANAARALKPGGAFYAWAGYANLTNYPKPLEAAGLRFSQCIVWDKQHPVLTRKDYMGAFEIAFYGWKSGAGHKFYGPNNAVDLWHVKKVSPQAMVHLTEKPVELAVRALQYSSRTGENVLDLFGGSGSTLIAAEQTNRRAFLMEIDPAYTDVIVQRWEKFTGKKAELVKAVSDRSNTPATAAEV